MSHALDLLKRANAQFCLDKLSAGPRSSASSDGSSAAAELEEDTADAKCASAEAWLFGASEGARADGLIGVAPNAASTQPESICSAATLSDVIFRLVNVRHSHESCAADKHHGRPDMMCTSLWPTAHL